MSLKIFFLVLISFISNIICDLPIEPDYEALYGPSSSSKSDFKIWYKNMLDLRHKVLDGMNYDDKLYTQDRTHWTLTNFIQPQVMIHDKYLYDRDTNTYTIDKFINDVNKRYNGIDSILLWQAYPNLGLDARNQFEMLNDLPNGGLEYLVKEFHKRNVKVFIPYNPWDVGTNESSLSDIEIIQNYVQEYGLDGFNGDTMYGVSAEFIEKLLNDVSGNLFVSQPESGLPDELLAYDSASWAYLVYPDGSYYTFAPMVSRPKWLEPRHVVQVCNRWCTNHTGDLQIAFFNGVGFETWENIWGVWNGLSDRDAESIRRISLLYHYFGKSTSVQSFVKLTNSSSKLTNANEYNINDVKSWIEFVKWIIEKYVFLQVKSIETGNPLLDPRFVKLAETILLNNEFDQLMKSLLDIGLIVSFKENLSPFEFELSFNSYELKLKSTDINMDSFFSSPDWIPFIPITDTYGLFASMFPAPLVSSNLIDNLHACIWNIINRLNYISDVTTIELPCDDDTQLFNLFRGELIKSTTTRTGNYFAELNITSPITVPGSLSNLICTYDLINNENTNNLVFASLLTIKKSDISDQLQAFLEMMKMVTNIPLQSYSDLPHTLNQIMVNYGKTTPLISDLQIIGMNLIPGSESYEFIVDGIEIETGLSKTADCQFPWEDAPSIYHNKTMKIESFYMDKTPITNSQYKLYLDKSGYIPVISKNYLKDWIIDENGSKNYPNGWDNKPINWITLNEAKEYCNYYGKRLPNDWEWQYAAQGGISTRKYPWGDVFDYNLVPQYDSQRSTRPLDDVDSHSPQSDSLYGISDLYGNAWEFTNVFDDDRTQFVLLRGGSLYYPQGSSWYIKQVSSLLQHQRQLLMSDSLDRSSMTTFRCVIDNY